MPEQVPSIYVVTNKVNGKQYVGQTWRPVEDRWKRHIRRAYRRKDECSALAAAIRKYGESEFVINSVQLPSGATQNDVDQAEIREIATRNTMYPNGYNLLSGGKGGRPSPETIMKRISALKGRPLTAEHRAKLSSVQRSRKKNSPAEVAGRIAAAEKLRGRKRPPEVIVRCLATKAGRPRSEAAKAASKRHSLFMRGRKATQAQKSKQSASLKAYYAVNPRTPEQCRQISERQKGRVFSDETRAKMRASRLRYLNERNRPVSDYSCQK